MFGSHRLLSVRILNVSTSLKKHMHCSPYLVVMGHMEWGCIIREHENVLIHFETSEVVALVYKAILVAIF